MPWGEFWNVYAQTVIVLATIVGGVCGLVRLVIYFDDNR